MVKMKKRPTRVYRTTLRYFYESDLTRDLDREHSAFSEITFDVLVDSFPMAYRKVWLLAKRGFGGKTRSDHKPVEPQWCEIVDLHVLSWKVS